MGAIGEYIHLTARGYEVSGINRPHHNPGISAAAAFSVQKQKINQKMQQYNKVSKATTQKIEDEMNKLLDELGDEPGGENTDSSALEQYMYEQINQEIGQLSSINWSNLSTVSAPAPVSRLSTGVYNFKDWRNRIISRVNEFNAMLKQLQVIQSASGGAAAEQVESLIKRLDKLVNDTYEKTYQHLNEIGYPVWGKSSTVKNMIRKLNELISEYNQIPIVENGDNRLLQAVISQVPGVAQVQAQRALSEAIVSGKNMTVSVEQMSNNGNVSANMGDLQENVFSNDNSIHITFNWKTRKMTAILNNLQLKNSRFQFINIGTETTLYDLLSDAGSDFANHYFNIFSKHQDAHTNLAGNRGNFNEVIKMLAIFKAFEKTNQSKDKVFIFTQGNNYVKVVSIGSILDRIVNNTGKMVSVNFDGISMSKIGLFANKKGPELNGASRIAQVLGEAHARKIKVALNSQALLGI